MKNHIPIMMMKVRILMKNSHNCCVQMTMNHLNKYLMKKKSGADVKIPENMLTAKDSRVSVKDEQDQKSTENSGENNVSSDNKDNSQEKEPDRFLELCKELTKDPNLNKHVEEFKDQLKVASEAFLSGNFRKAAENYKAARERVGAKLSEYEIDERQYHVIKYAHCTALINLGTYEDIVKAIQMLSEMKIYEFSIPALYIQLSCAYCKLNRYKTALEPLEKVQDILDNLMIFPTFTWPGTMETILETTPAGLRDSIKELNQWCRMSHKPTARCRYSDCLKTSTHILPSELIYRSDPDFVGFIRMICEEKCHIEFHIACWKSYKEANNGIGKPNDKDFLGRQCLTMDCVNSEGKLSIVTVIEVIDADGQVKSVNRLDPKTAVDSKKSKKKKCKLDDKEKTGKQKKTVEKKVREVKKPAAVVVVEEEEEVVEPVRTNTIDTEKELKLRIQSLKELRMLGFGKWDPSEPFYGRLDEMEKWIEKCENKSSIVQYIEYSNDQSIDVKDAKDFLFSYFMEILKVEGPLKQADVEDLWKTVAEDFCNIKVVLPNLKSMCDLLIESTCFCQIEDYICLAAHLDNAYKTVKTEMVETVNFLMSGTPNTNPPPAKSQLPDLLRHQKTSKPELDVSQSSSDDDSSESEDEYISDQSVYLIAEVSDQENSDVEELEPPREEFEEKIIPPVEEEEFLVPKLEEVDSEKFSLQKMLDEMSRVKNMFMKTTPEESKADNKDEEVFESPNNDTFETACGSLQNYSDNDKDLSDGSVEDHKTQLEPSDINIEDIDVIDIAKENIEDVVLDHSDKEGDIGNSIGHGNITEEIEIPSDTDNTDCNKASQIGEPVEERQMQTTSLETQDSHSQTMDSDMYKELMEKVQELTTKNEKLTVENDKLSNEVADKDRIIRENEEAHKKVVASVKNEHEKTATTLLDHIQNLEDDHKKTVAGYRKKEDSLTNEVTKLKEFQLKLMSDNQTLIKEVTTLAKQKKELETKEEALEIKLKAKIISSQQAQLITTKAFWDSQVNLLGKRCVEKISEMHSWFSLLPSGEVEELPSWRDVRQITMQWGDISNKIQQIQSEFQIKYSDLESRLSREEELDDLSSFTLPTLPDEPNPLPLDKIHKEITEKHTRKISELTQLVANQQLEIEKIKESSQKLQQLMGPFQASSRMQTPLTTAFGSLAFQYSYPQNLPSQIGSTNIPTLPSNQDILKMGVTKPLQGDVQTLLKESTAAKFSMFPTESSSLIGSSSTPLPNASGSTFSSSFLKTITPPSMGLPPPPMGVAQTLFKSSSSILTDKKDKKPADQSAPLKLEQSKPGSSRESTPVPISNQTPDKPKKKKKNKVEVREEFDLKAASHVPEAATMSEDNDPTPWSVAVNKKTLPKHTPQYVPTTDSKLKNKKRLLDKLQLKFPTMPLKELDEIVKLVREQNNGSLSGLPFEEIETRVERFITKKQFQKSTTMGLVKFTEAAWGPVKPQETVKWTNLQLEECTICLELMGNDRTKVDCNHEFHTKCLRKWLKEKSVCPLCNKFTTMPDEFPAL